jgi:urea transporter
MNVLQGFSFLMWRNNPIAGLALLGLLLIYNPWIGLSALLGNAAATIAARYVMRLDRRLIRYGLFGANGMYAGLLWAPFLPGESGLIVIPLGLAVATAPLTALLVRGLSVKSGLPVLLLPFFLVGWLLWAVMPLLPVRPAETLLIGPWWAPLEAGVESWMPPVAAGLFRGLSQLMFGDSILLGLAILALWTAGSRRVGVITLVSFGLFWLLTRTNAPVDGLTQWAGINGAMTAFCLGAVFMRPTVSSQAYGLAGGVAAALLTRPVSILFSELDVPVFAFPFLAVTLALLLVPRLPLCRSVAAFFGLNPVPLAMVGRPEGFHGEFLQ